MFRAAEARATDEAESNHSHELCKAKKPPPVGGPRVRA